MRYIGNKTRLLDNIEALLKEKKINDGTFADLFTGTASVADHFKDKFKIITNDTQHYATIFAIAKLNNSDIPYFKTFRKKYGCSPFDYFNSISSEKLNEGFVTNNYSPKGGRMFFNVENAKKIDFIRIRIDEMKGDGILDNNEYFFLLASLIESVTRVSNTSGTYEAFFKTWESRSKKVFKLFPLTMEKKHVKSTRNECYTLDANILARQIKGDVAYIDTPYTVTQYASAYHVLETIALYDDPVIKGKTGRRNDRAMSNYSRKNKAIDEFKDLFRQLNFKHIIVSYSNQGLVPLSELISVIKEFAIEDTIDIKYIDFQEYSNLNKSKKRGKDSLKEVLIYFKKNTEVIKSPLNYAGSKDEMVPKIINNLPKKISSFVDCMAGAANVGINISGVDEILFNEKQKYVLTLIQLFMQKSDKNSIVNLLKEKISKLGLDAKSKGSYLNLRSSFNDDILKGQEDILDFYLLTLYSFQHMIRFNKKGLYNVPVGNSGYNQEIENRILNFRSKTKRVEFKCGDYRKIKINSFNRDTLFYFDPPYIITSAAYNDGKRMDMQWTEDDEIELLDFISDLNKSGYKFLLSNVIEHKGKKNDMLLNWINKNKFIVVDAGKTGKRFPRQEVLIRNYRIEG